MQELFIVEISLPYSLSVTLWRMFFKPGIVVFRSTQRQRRLYSALHWIAAKYES